MDVALYSAALYDTMECNTVCSCSVKYPSRSIGSEIIIYGARVIFFPFVPNNQIKINMPIIFPLIKSTFHPLQTNLQFLKQQTTMLKST